MLTRTVLILSVLISLISSAGVTYKVCEAVYNGRLAKHKEDARVAKEAAVAVERTICTANANKTKESGDALQTKYKNILDRFNALNNKLRVINPDDRARVHITESRRSNDATSGGDVLPVLGGIEVGELIAKLKQADDQTAQLIQCQAWVKQLEDENQYPPAR